MSERDREEASRGLVAPFDPPVVEDERRRVVWDLRSYDFLDGEPPDTTHPNLWRQGQLTRIAGLFELAPGFYQLRGFDLSNMHIVEGDAGIVVIDPLISAETAAAALALYREHRGNRPVTGLIYTHSHVDHFGGAKGVVHEPPADAALLVDREALDRLLLKTADIAELMASNRLRFEGDGEKIGELLGLLDEPDPGFPIVTPRA